MKKIFVRNNIDQYLKAKGYTQLDLAEALNVSKQQMHRWVRERIEPRADVRARICEILDVPFSALFYLGEISD